MKKNTTAGILALVGLMALAGWGIAGPADNPPTHPEVEGAVTADACDVCHKEVTPEIFSEWYNSQHGMLSIKCFVCHGSTGEDFTTEPTDDRCVGCHADQVETMAAPFMKDKGCFTCHPAHALMAHLPMAVEGGEK